MFDIYQVRHGVGRCVKQWNALLKPGVKVNEQYHWDILLSQQISILSYSNKTQAGTLCTKYCPTAAVQNSPLSCSYITHSTVRVDPIDYKIESHIAA